MQAIEMYDYVKIQSPTGIVSRRKGAHAIKKYKKTAWENERLSHEVTCFAFLCKAWKFEYEQW